MASKHLLPDTPEDSGNKASNMASNALRREGQSSVLLNKELSRRISASKEAERF